MKRWHQELHIAVREWKKHRKSHVDSNKDRSVGYGRGQARPGTDPFVVTCDCDEQVGRFRKKDAWDCGNTRCYICHGDKLMGYKTRQELISDINFEEQVRELKTGNVNEVIRCERDSSV